MRGMKKNNARINEPNIRTYPEGETMVPMARLDVVAMKFSAVFVFIRTWLASVGLSQPSSDQKER